MESPEKKSATVAVIGIHCLSSECNNASHHASIVKPEEVILKITLFKVFGTNVGDQLQKIDGDSILMNKDRLIIMHAYEKLVRRALVWRIVMEIYQKTLCFKASFVRKPCRRQVYFNAS